MSKRKKLKPGAPFRGFRMGVVPKRKVDLSSLEKCSVLTYLENEIVQEYLDRCRVEVKDKEGKVTETKITASPKHIARLDALLEKPVKDAKVDAKGDAWERPKPLSEKEIEEMNKKTVKEKNKKSKSRKDLEKKDEDRKDKKEKK